MTHTDIDAMPRPEGNELQCTVCGLLFTSLSAFDRHMNRDGTCEHPETVTSRTGDRYLFPRTRQRDGIPRTVWGGRYNDTWTDEPAPNLL